MIPVGIIGFGKMGKIRAQVIQESRRGVVVGICDPSETDLPKQIKQYPTAEALIQAPEIQAVFVCTPNYLNKPLTIAALKQGKHVFCEKPPAFTANEVEEIIAAERISQKKLMYGFNHRHHESIRKVKEFVDSGEYGRILWMRGRYGKSVGESFYNNWRAKKELAGGGILIDQGIHMCDLFLMFAGDFEEVQAIISNLYWKLNVEDNVFAIFRNRDGIVASLHSTMTQWRHLFSLEVFLEKGYIVINGLKTPSGTYGKEMMSVVKNRTEAPSATWTEQEDIYFEVNDSWLHEVNHFFDAVEKEQPIIFGHSRDAWKLMHLVDRIYQAGQNHKEWS
ncbi:MAG: oxidoreductase [Deltaproteobacteria bacterium RIFCSPLOWO2_01_44_7]|nr:MAG: oxidoreductase [Deltaproteobacteria bacterium RIFCSPHIGHO2_01_FULL_43_49]OGQ16096.1 MAG: oxidoreductase [Deltaproteobacteria bacterium RIFCSPHIGHO2_02_FULL_44_53]OGQ29057.1 MAG: oxidoreductase [Deltaproteobacteria bacterium RIFCSPHIGHO2_12_FULL_44_21]OGQ32613.1 MAG: oxidoreductase [Deltaproteobacteria bacterium RIFCSPLOWO2_01_FULL_45_74]OGQ38355.1 MAG: oxidoreductase [Deltaproteobacteria bacterium RIFCSPLOWO2_01_44_7]OGQ41714.1 MAG: oxidoreductase [Deltaproteobacteria bacterium RIFCSPL